MALLTLFNISKKNQIGRFRLVALNMLNNLMIPFFNVIVSAFIIRHVSVAFWGAYAKTVLFLSIGIQLALWGNKEFLLKEFSRLPATARSTWIRSLQNRNFLVSMVCLLLFLALPWQLALICIPYVWIRTIFVSYEPVIAFTGRFALKTKSEVAGSILFLLLLLVFRNNLSVSLIIAFLMTTELLKLLFLALCFRKNYPVRLSLKPDAVLLKQSAGFLLLSLSGFIIYKSDQLFTATFLDTTAFGKYQVWMGFLLVIHALAGYSIQPLLKLIYRSRTTTVSRLSMKLFLRGTLFVALSVFTTRYIMLYLYQVDMSLLMMAGAYLFLVPVYYYAPLLFYCFAAGKQFYVTAINLAGAALTFICCLLFSHFFVERLSAVMFSAAASQWMMLAAYVWLHQKRHSSKEEDAERAEKRKVRSDFSYSAGA